MTCTKKHIHNTHAYTGFPEVVKVLLDKGAAPDAVNNARSAALHLAAASGHSSVAGVCVCVAMCCRVLQGYCRVLQGIARCCRVLQCVAVCCSVLRCQHRTQLCTALRCCARAFYRCWCVHVCRCVLHCGAGCYRVLQGVSVCCGVKNAHSAAVHRCIQTF